MAAGDLAGTARALVAEGKGILAADESTGTIKKRLDSIGVESTEETRRAYRDLLFTTEGAAEHISGVILYDETIRQSASDGTPFPKLLEGQGIIPGIKVDTGAKPLAGSPERDGHGRPRRAARAARGVPRARRPLHEVARGDHDRRRHPHALLHPRERARARPLRGALAGGGARPDRRARGPDGRHSHDRAVVPTSPRTRSQAVFHELYLQRVELEGMLLKPNMVLSGYESSERRRRGRGRRADDPLPARQRARGRAGDRLPLRRPERRARDRAPERDEPTGPAPVGALASPTAARSRRRRSRPGAARRRTSRPAQEAYLHRARMNGLARTGDYTEEREREAVPA